MSQARSGLQSQARLPAQLPAQSPAHSPAQSPAQSPALCQAQSRSRLRLLPLRRWCARFRGLAGRPPPRGAIGVWLQPCRAVHTLGMRYPLDLFFLDHNKQVIKVVAGLPPRRLASCLRAVSVVELQAGVVDIENGGIGRVEAAVQDAARRDIHGNLQNADQVPR
ncbi:hypothetical protein CEY04_14530 [Achromobacter sp. HZ28]|nr:hypothetical protein CEY04_14530 [Achromobacter sp. HZ28]OWT78070.1 hypothetical protein CEY05_09025 [Achromobacter sp. HZ34]